MNVFPIKKTNYKHSISVRLLKIVLSIYFALTFVVTGTHIYIEYSAAKEDIKKELEITEQTFTHSLAEVIWNFDRQTLQIAAEGITKLPSVIGVEIFNERGEMMQHAGQTPSASDASKRDIFWHEFPLNYVNGNVNQRVGKVRLISSNSIVFNRIKIGVFILLISAIIKTAALVILITIVFNRLLTRPLGELAKKAENIDLNNIHTSHIHIQAQDESELSVLERALNKMMDKVILSLNELENLNRALEKKVTERTASLNNTVIQLDKEQKELQREVAIRMEKEQALLTGRIELENSLAELKQTQEQLIEAEKMASLGSLVAGVAHEINTPVGVSLTGITHFQYLLHELETRYQNQELEEEQFEQFMEDTKEIAQSVRVSLERAANLVKSFKQVAVDQTHEVVRKFNVHSYVSEVMLSLGSLLKHTALNVELECDESIEIKGYPGSLSQVITNFINNALTHAYEDGQKGTIKLIFRKQEEQLLFIFSDDGKGQSKDVEENMFNPFFTTNREKGGSGLGLNIVYNLVTQKMKGRIKVDSKPDIGTTFTILIPLDIDKQIT